MTEITKIVLTREFDSKKHRKTFKSRMTAKFFAKITRLFLVVRLVLCYNIYGVIDMRLRIDTNKDGTKNYYVLESFRTDSKKTTTPKPPIYWVELRQKSRLCGKASMSVKIVAPVVV